MRWREIRDRDPEAWAEAVEVDRAIRTGLHRSTVPLDQANLSTPANRGQLDLWGNEREGMCGVQRRARHRRRQ